MTETLSKIRSLLPEAPRELADLYDQGQLPEYPDLRIEFMSLEGALDYTQALARWWVPDELGLWALNDANDSNPYGYITKGPCKGAILHFFHDDGPTVDFPDLASFVAAMEAAGQAGLDIDLMKKTEKPTYDCKEAIESLLQEGNIENETMICLYIDCSEDLPDHLVTEAAEHESLHIRESIAIWLTRNPAPQHLPLAKALAEDRAGQVARPGKVARKAINRLIHS